MAKAETMAVTGSERWEASGKNLTRRGGLGTEVQRPLRVRDDLTRATKAL